MYPQTNQRIDLAAAAFSLNVSPGLVSKEAEELQVTTGAIAVKSGMPRAHCRGACAGILGGARCFIERQRLPSISQTQWTHHGPLDVNCRGDLQSSRRRTRAARAGTRRRMSASVVALTALALGAALLLQSLAARAAAKTTVGTKLDIIMRSGEQHSEHPFRWRGISADWVNGDRRDLPRFDVRVVCSERCPSDVLPTEVGQDTVVWKTGPNTKGYVEVSCEERCVVRQSGQSRPWDDVRYVQLRPSLGGCFAQSAADKARQRRLAL
jgi:hypothetical protein